MNKKIEPIHPGEILLEDFLIPMDISQYRLAKDINVPPRRINEIVLGKRIITADTALRLSEYFRLSEKFWLNLQMKYNLEIEKDRLKDKLMSKFTDFIDGILDESDKLAKKELKQLISSSKKDTSDFVRLQAENFERWTVMLADGDLTVKGYKKLVKKMEVLTQLEIIKLKVSAKASAQRLANGIQEIVVKGLFSLI